LPWIANGSVIEASSSDGLYVEHGGTLTYNCSNGFLTGKSNTTCCNNGTWMTTPLCHPAPCHHNRPRDLKDGMVRFHMTQHGDRAEYKCDPGFSLVGDAYVTCEYGNWTSKRFPKCEPKHCEFPGVLNNGTVMLVGVIGKYEYREYVRRVGHNEKIEYHCDKEFRRNGPVGATCVDGSWSPPHKPKCLPKQHPHQYYRYMFRGRRPFQSAQHNGS
jgi:CUB/sushi domain-containing protein